MVVTPRHLLVLVALVSCAGPAFAQQSAEERDQPARNGAESEGESATPEASGPSSDEQASPGSEGGIDAEREVSGSPTGWSLGPRIGVLLHDVDPNGIGPDERQTALGGVAGFSGVWLHRKGLTGWQAGFEQGIWLKTSTAQGVGQWTIAVPFMARLQYNFGGVSARYQMGVSIGSFTSVHELFSTQIGVGCDVVVWGQSFSLDLLYQTSPFRTTYNDGSTSQSTIYIGNLGVQLW